jgi:acetyl/propionyl-CoA carboxylase alpha subunit
MAKLIATAESRPLAIDRLAAALREFQIEGVRTNVPFLIRILELPAFRDGTIDTGFLDREGAGLAASLPAMHIRATSDEHRATSPETRALSDDPWNAGPAVPAPSRRSASDGHARRRKPADGGAEMLTAPMPANVITINVKPGDTVKKGDILMLLEAMKMELPVRAPHEGTVRTIRCREGELVEAEAVLLELQ